MSGAIRIIDGALNWALDRREAFYLRQRTREKLPADRPAATTTVEWQGQRIHVQVGFYLDGRPGEVFCTANKEGSTLRTMLDEWGIAVSRLLQWGCTLDEIKGGMTFDAMGQPETPQGAVVLAAIEIAHFANIRKYPHKEPDPNAKMRPAFEGRAAADDE